MVAMRGRVCVQMMKHRHNYQLLLLPLLYITTNYQKLYVLFWSTFWKLFQILKFKVLFKLSVYLHWQRSKFCYTKILKICDIPVNIFIYPQHINLFHIHYYSQHISYQAISVWHIELNFENRGGLYSHFAMKRRSINKYIAYTQALHRDRRIQWKNFSDCIALSPCWWMKLSESLWDDHWIICP